MAEWISGNRYLSTAEMQNNAVIIRNTLNSYGWSLNAIAAVLGNMQSESSINPGIWESLQPNTSRGFGLVQWTPATKLIDWAGSNYQNGYVQLERIQYEANNGLQWFRNPAAPIVEPPISFLEFTTSTEPVATLANYFLWFYEHPANPIQPNRAEQAEYWYEYLSGSEPEPPDPNPPVPKPSKPMKFYYYLVLRRR